MPLKHTTSGAASTNLALVCGAQRRKSAARKLDALALARFYQVGEADALMLEQPCLVPGR